MKSPEPRGVKFGWAEMIRTEIIILKSTIPKYKANLERLPGYPSTNTTMHTITISAT